MTQKELARSLGITDRTLRNWKRDGCPVDRGIPAVLKWKEANDPSRPAAGRDGEDLKSRLLLAQAEHYETKTKLAELEHRVRMGELVTLEAVEELLRRWYGPISDYLRSQPERLAARVNPSDPEHARQVLAEERAAVFKLAKETIHADAG